MNKEVSVVLPTIGRMDYLDIAINSLLNQSKQFDEIIVFDNSINQNVKDLSEFKNEPRIRWEQSGGQVDVIQSCNSSVSFATKEYVTIMGDDDILSEHFNEEATKLLNSSYDMVLLPFTICDEKGNVVNYLKNSELFCSISSKQFRQKRIEGKFGLMLSGVIFKKEKFESVNGFERNQFPNQMFSDEFLWMKLSFLEKQIGCSDRVCWNYRKHSGQFLNVSDARGFIKGADFYLDKLYKNMNKYNIAECDILPQGMNKINYKKKIVFSWYKTTQVYCLKNKLYKQFMKNLFSIFSSDTNFLDILKFHFKIILGYLSK